MGVILVLAVLIEDRGERLNQRNNAMQIRQFRRDGLEILGTPSVAYMGFGVAEVGSEEPSLYSLG